MTSGGFGELRAQLDVWRAVLTERLNALVVPGRSVPGPADLVVRPGTGADPTGRSDPVSVALRRKHRLLTPLGPVSTLASPTATPAGGIP